MNVDWVAAHGNRGEVDLACQRRYLLLSIVEAASH
jgi:hypothetical protein